MKSHILDLFNYSFQLKESDKRISDEETEGLFEKYFTCTLSKDFLCVSDQFYIVSRKDCGKNLIPSLLSAFSTIGEKHAPIEEAFRVVEFCEIIDKNQWGEYDPLLDSNRMVAGFGTNNQHSKIVFGQCFDYIESNCNSYKEILDKCKEYFTFVTKRETKSIGPNPALLTALLAWGIGLNIKNAASIFAITRTLRLAKFI